MGTGDYICITMTGGAPWGFRLQGGKEEKQPLQIAKVRNKSKAANAGLCEGDEVISINGNPCADLAYSEVITLMEGLTDTLQMLIKRSLSGINETLSPENENRDNIKNNKYKESTTLQIRTAMQRPHMEWQITGATNEMFQIEQQSAVVDSSVAKQEKETAHCHKIPPKVIEAPKAQLINVPAFSGETGERAVPTVELQLSLSHDRHKDSSVPSLKVLGAEKHKCSETGFNLQQDGSSLVTSAPAAEKDPSVQHSTRTFQIAPCKEVKAVPEAETKEPSFTKVEVILDCSDREKEASRSLAEKGCVDSQVEGGQIEAPPSVVSFGISSEGTEQGEDDQHSEREHSRPHKHRARHARLRRSESLSEKQVKEAKSKCKSIALLLTAAPNPNSKGVLMFKKRRQRARKYTLVSYGTGELERDEDEGDEFEGEEESEKDNTFEVTLLGTSESEIDEDLFSDLDKEGRIVTFDWDTGLLEVEKKPKSVDEMQMLPESKGKGALMFAKRRQRVDQVTAEQEAMKMQVVHSTEGHREATSTENTSKISSSLYQVKQEETSRTQSHVSKSYIEVSRSHGTTIQQNGIGGAPETNVLYQSSEALKSASLNRTAKPFPNIQNRAAAPFSPTRSMTSPLSDLPAPPPYASASPPPEALYRTALTPVANTAPPALWSPTESTEQIASRDERIAVPAKRTGILQEAKRRNTAKPMFTFKDTPKVSPNPALLSLVQNSEGKKGTATGFESGPEEDYLSLGAEACNFMQIQAAKQKVPPPVAPKPALKVSPTDTTPISPVWSPPAVAVAQPPAFPAPRSPEEASPAPVKTAQPAFPPPQPPSTLNLAGPFKGPPTAASHQNYTPKMTPTTPLGNAVLAGGVGPAFEMPPALSGKGAQLFAKRQSRMEKYVVDSETVQANMARASSPTPSLPACWKYSSNVRAPPPVAYNPIQSPSYPLAATKPQSKSPSVAKTTKKKPKKALSSLEVMKHQPYQLNASLFTFQPPSDKKELPVPKQPAKSDSVPASRSLNAGSPANVRASSVYSVPAYSSQPFSQSNASSPVIESCVSTSYPAFLKQEPAVSSSVTTPRPKFSAKKVGVAAQERDGERSLSLPGWPPSTTLRSMSPVSPVTFQPAPDYFGKPPPAVDKPGKRLTPWEAAAKSPLGLVDDAFGPQTIQESIVANVVSAARRKTLPAPPDDWKQKVAYQPPASSAHAKLASFGRSHSAAISSAKSTMSAPGSTVHCGSRLQYAYYGQRARTDPDMVSMDSRSDYCLSIADSNYNPYPKGWRRQT